MSSYPLSRRDTRVRFSEEHGSAQTREDDIGDPNRPAFPVAELQTAYSPLPYGSPNHFRREPGTLANRPSPDGYGENQESGHFPPVRGVPSGNRFGFGNAGADPSEADPTHILERIGGYNPESRLSNARIVGQGSADSEETLRDEGFEMEQRPEPPGVSKDHSSLAFGYPTLPPNALRYNKRRSYSADFSAPVATRGGSGSALEAGPGNYRDQRGTLLKLMHTYGLLRTEHQTSVGGVSTEIDDRYQSQVVSRAGSNESANSILRLRRGRRIDSTVSFGGDTLLDDDDPRVTGAKPNRIDDENKARETFNESLKNAKKMKEPCIVLNINTVPDRQKFILRLAKALMAYGAPSHRIESQLVAAARVLEVDASFVHLPSIIIASFGDPASNQSETHFVKSSGGLDLGKLQTTHNIYRRVVHDEIGAKDGTLELMKIMRQKPIYGLRIRIVLALLCSAIICPVGFGGSFVDMWISGIAGGVLCWLQLYAASKSALFSNVFEISAAMLVSFVARGLASLPSGKFCYSAISSAGVVLILPGFMVLCSSLELASKNLISGSVKMVYAIVYSLFLGFSLTIGSDLYYLVDAGARHRREQATQVLGSQSIIHGTFKSDNTSVFPFDGTFTFKNVTGDIPASQHYQAKGCYRDPNWPWYLHQFPQWTFYFLVPLFSLFGSFASMQPLWSMQLPVMVFISCAAFAANTAANQYIFNRSDVVSAIGAFVVGVLGNLYSRIFRGTAFVVMVNGIGFLIPSGIAAAGGLAQNYRGSDTDQYTSGLSLGFRMVQVAIGITVGLFGSGLIVYSFGSRKKGALFAF